MVCNERKKFNLEEIKQFAKNLRRKVLDMAYYAGANSSHFGGALSSAEIISYLYGYYMNLDKKNPYGKIGTIYFEQRSWLFILLCRTIRNWLYKK